MRQLLDSFRTRRAPTLVEWRPAPPTPLAVALHRIPPERRAATGPASAGGSTIGIDSDVRSSAARQCAWPLRRSSGPEVDGAAAEVVVCVRAAAGTRRSNIAFKSSSSSGSCSLIISPVVVWRVWTVSTPSRMPSALDEARSATASDRRTPSPRRVTTEIVRSCWCGLRNASTTAGIGTSEFRDPRR